MIDLAPGLHVILHRSGEERLLHSRIPSVYLHYCETLHPESVEHAVAFDIAEHADKPIVVSTQNPYVFDNLALVSADDIRERVLLYREGAVCRMSEEDAEGVWRALQTKAQHVSEILRWRGLW